MKNPFNYVLNSRTVWDKANDVQRTEVLVRFKDEEPSWISYSSLIALMSLY